MQSAGCGSRYNRQTRPGTRRLRAGDLLATFPDARVVATSPVVGYIHQAAEIEARQWAAMFGDRVAKPTAVPEILDGLTIDLEGHHLRIVEVGQGDIQPSTVVLPGRDRPGNRLAWEEPLNGADVL